MASHSANGDAHETPIEEQLAALQLHEPAGQILSRIQTDQFSGLIRQPALPPEVIERIVRHLQAGAIVGDPQTQLTLIRLSCVSRLIRFWALETLYSILVLPRHVREFRKWYSRSVKSQPAFQFAGHTRALFCALDDVSNLTSFSAGWDHELLRLLHYCGPDLTHLSLWRAESNALLRDPGQVREGYRFGTAQPVHVWGEKQNVADDEEEDAVQEDIEDRDLVPESKHADDLFSNEELEDMPGWLQAEIRALGTRAVTIRHKAHLTPTRRIKRRHQGCQPTHLSLMISLPLLEHEDPKVFSKMSIWYRVQELDIHISTPGHTPKILRLISSLSRSPIRRLRISTTFTSLCMTTPPFPRSKRREEAGNGVADVTSTSIHNRAARAGLLPEINLCECLDSILKDEALRRVLVDEFQGRHYNALPSLERLLLQRCVNVIHPQVTSNSNGHSENPQGEKPLPMPFFDSTTVEHSLRISVTRGNQAVWGKLKERLWDFRQRAEGLSDGAWEVLS